jgi:hypothetical protein
MWGKTKKILWKCNVVVYGRLMAELEKRSEQTINGTASLFFLPSVLPFFHSFFLSLLRTACRRTQADVGLNRDVNA